MILHGSQQLLNLSYQRDLPEGLIEGLYIRYAGDAAAGITIGATDLGQVRVNYRGSDIVNVPVSFLSNMNNLFYGAAEASSTVAAAFAFSAYVPFHAPWDTTNGLLNQMGDKLFVQLTFPLLTAAKIDSGTVEVYYIPARGVAGYLPTWSQQNIQVGGAGTVIERVQNFNVSSLFVDENAHITGQVLVFKDGVSVINATQAVLKAKSNLDNRVETALTLVELNLNPTRAISASLSNTLEFQAGMDAATTIAIYYLSFLFQTSRGSSATTLTVTPQEGGVKAVAGQGGIPATASAAYLADLNARY